MYRKVILKTFVFPVSSSALSAAAVVSSSDTKDEEKKVLVRPRDLSIYSKPEQQSSIQETEPKPESALLAVVRQVRESVWMVTDQLAQVTDKMNNILETGKAHTSSTIQILRDEENNTQRYGAIAVGGLLGYILAIRRGWFRRLVYTGTGAAAVAAVCYPEEAKEYSNEGFRYTKRYIVVAYHFVNGVLRDYVGVQMPNLPGPLNIGSNSAAEKDSSTVPTSAALMPHPASTPSHINSGPIPMPPIDTPKYVSDPEKKQGSSTKKNTSKASKKDQEKSNLSQEPQPTSFVLQDPSDPVAERNEDYSNFYSRRA